MQFINHRQYFVRINKKTASSPIVPDSGIPQGSHLGPVVFILACNSIANRLSPTTRLFQYADDTVLMQPILDGTSEDELQLSIDALDSWANENGMKINPGKSAVMKFSKHRSDVLTKYNLKDAIIPTVSFFKYLGVTLDEKLTYNIHTQNIKERCCRLVFAAARLCKTIKNPGLIVKLYQVCIDPIVCYAATVWAFRNKTTMAAPGETHRIATRLCLKIPPTPLAPNYIQYEARCRKLHTPLNDDRLAYIAMTNIKKITTNYTYSENAVKITNAMNAPEDNRRVQKPFVDPAVKFHYNNTPLQYVLSVMQRLNILHSEWNAEWGTFKRLIKERHLLT